MPKILDACCRTLLVIGLAGCGQKGPLYLPPAAAPAASIPPGAAPAASAPAPVPTPAPLPIPPAPR